LDEKNTKRIESLAGEAHSEKGQWFEKSRGIAGCFRVKYKSWLRLKVLQLKIEWLKFSRQLKSLSETKNLCRKAHKVKLVAKRYKTFLGLSWRSFKILYQLTIFGPAYL